MRGGLVLRGHGCGVGGFSVALPRRCGALGTTRPTVFSRDERDPPICRDERDPAEVATGPPGWSPGRYVKDQPFVSERQYDTKTTPKPQARILARQLLWGLSPSFCGACPRLFTGPVPRTFPAFLQVLFRQDLQD